MDSRQRVMAVLEGKKPDRFPVDIWYTDEVREDLKNFYTVDNDMQLYDTMGVDKIVWVFPGYKEFEDSQASGSQVGAEAGGDRTMWGVPLKKVKSGKAIYHEFGDPPLKYYDSPTSLNDYPYWPEPDKVDYESAKQIAEKAHDKYATIGPWMSFFEIYCQMRGLEQSLMDVAVNPDLVNAILDEIEDRQTTMLNRFLQDLKDAVDLVFISDDIGMQQGLLISPEIWRYFFKDRLKRWCEIIHNYGKKVFYHSDGAFEPLIPELIECGIDVLNPIQHVCPGMDTANLKDKYGSKIIFHGGIDNQSVLPFGDAESVRKETVNCLKTLGSDGKGYIVCSCHNIQAGTPVNNIVTMVETVQEFIQ